MTWSNIVRVGLGWMLFSAWAYSQVTTGSISGAVKDTSGAVVPGASIIAINEETGSSRTVHTDTAGRYLLPSLAPGHYRVTASMDGFQTNVRSGIDLTIGRQLAVNFDLAIGSVTESVEVTAEAPLVNTVGGSLGNTIESTRISELPLNGRDLAQLVTLQAGVVNYTAGDSEPGGGKLLVVSGARPTTNVFYIDGVAIESYNKKTPTGMSGNFLGADGIREFKVDSNAYSAEFGGGAGGIFNISTKSGTNSFHGTAFWAMRNDNLDAAQWEDNAFSSDKPEFKRNQFGFSLGGPVRKDKTFFFGNFEALRERLGRTSVARTFSDSLRRGFVPPATTPLAIDPRISPYLAFWPQPNGETSADGTADFISVSTIPTDDSYFQERLDHQFTNSNSWFLRYTYLTSEQLTPPVLTDEAGVRNTQANHLVSMEDKHIFSPTLLNSLRVGFSRTQPFNGLTNPRTVDPALRFTPKYPYMGTLNPGSGLNTVGVAEATSDRHINSYQLVDDVLYTHGRSTYKFGISWSRNGFNVYFPSQPAGNYTFGTVSNFLRGIPNTFRGAIIDGYDDAYRTLKWNLLALYFQNELRLTPRLTLNPGLRYEFGTVPQEKWGRVANFRGDLDYILKAGVNDIKQGNPWIENPTLRNFAPRIGLGYDLFGDGRTALRAGFGLFFVQLDQSWFRTMLWRMPPFLVDLQASGANVPFPNIYALCGRENPFTPSNPVCTGRPAPQFPPFKTRSPYMMQYNVSVQRQFGTGSVLTVGYSGSRGVRLNALTNVNIPYAESINGRLVFNATARPNRNFDNMLFRGPMADSFYNALQVSLLKRMGSLQLTASYTYSKTIDDISGNAGGSDSDVTETNSFYQDKSLFRGLSAYDARNVFTSSVNYELPFGRGKRLGASLGGIPGKLASGWEIASILTLRDGFPGSITIGNRLTGIGVQNERPDLMPGANGNPTSGESAGCAISNAGVVFSSPSVVPAGTVIGRVVQPGTPLGTAEAYFDPCAFNMPPTRTFGNLGRNTFILPGFVGVDVTLTKNTALTEHTNLQFKFEAFNLLNRVNLGNPSRNVFDTAGRPSSIAGRIQDSQSARQIQLSLKLAF